MRERKKTAEAFKKNPLASRKIPYFYLNKIILLSVKAPGRPHLILFILFSLNRSACEQRSYFGAKTGTRIMLSPDTQLARK